MPARSSSISRLSFSSTEDEGRFAAGTLIAGRYRVIGLLGRGGMGEVYRATDLTLAQSVALKFLPEDASSNERLLERFHNEVRIARQVSHANVCRVYDIGEADGMAFISMEYVDGEDLASLLERIGRLPPDKALEITRKLCAGLAAAHERGVIHRDLKPHNVMLNKRGEVVIMDFGLAAIAGQLSGNEARSGTPAYMAPEQLRGDSVTAKSDIYSLGLMVYELFTGKRAFTAESIADLLRAEETSHPVSMTSVTPDLDPAIERVVLRCLHADPAMRPPTALAVAAALPGGDPLAAALAAGETPSPELVAASGHMRGFALRYAVPCLVFVLLGAVLYPFVQQPASMLASSPMESSPEVLEQKARDIAVEAGYPAKPLDWTGWFFTNEEMVNYLEKHRANKTWPELFSAESPIDFYYRQSPRYLVSPPDGKVNATRPALNVPGMTAIQLDSRGRLRHFEAVAPRFENQTGSRTPQTAFDAAAMFAKAGLDLGTFHEVGPTYTPALAFDTRKAWTGPYPGLPNVNVTVEVAAWNGKLTSFFIRWPWTKTNAPPQSTRDFGFTLFYIFMSVTGLLCVILITRYNIKRGRGDRKGAFRFASAALILYVISLLDMHVMPTFDMLDIAWENVASGLAFCALFWLLYMALEPLVRARWPHSLITWNRVLGGQLGDPRVGSHILVGGVIAIALLYLFALRTHWITAAGGPLDGTRLDVVQGVRPFISAVASIMFSALFYGTVMFFLLCGIRVLVRYDWAAAAVAGILLSFNEGTIRTSTHLALDLPLMLAVYGAFLFVLLRMGLVPMYIGIFVVNVMAAVPVSSDFAAWYNPAAAALIAIVCGTAIFAFVRSQAPAAADSIQAQAWRPGSMR